MSGTEPLEGAVRGMVETPWGELTVVAVDGVVVASCFGDPAWLDARLVGVEVRPGPVPPALAEAVAAYVAGDPGALDRVPARQPGGPFRQRAWHAMRAIEPGQTRSYAWLAAEAGNPQAVRAAGSACARNLLAPFVPCHRVVRSDGSLGGYAYGLELKAALLAHERAGARDA